MICSSVGANVVVNLVCRKAQRHDPFRDNTKSWVCRSAITLVLPLMIVISFKMHSASFFSILGEKARPLQQNLSHHKFVWSRIFEEEHVAEISAQQSVMVWSGSLWCPKGPIRRRRRRRRRRKIEALKQKSKKSTGTQWKTHHIYIYIYIYIYGPTDSIYPLN